MITLSVYGSGSRRDRPGLYVWGFIISEPPGPVKKSRRPETAAAAACVLTVAGWLLGIHFMKKKEF